MPEETNWLTYYQRLTGREPRAVLTRVLALFETHPTSDAPHPASDAPRQAIDLGCGDGTETRVLIEQGWRVLAIDREPDAIRLVESKIPVEKRGALQVQIASFEDARLVAADLIFAGFSLPFCAPQNFDAVWRNLTEAIRPGGRFAGHLCGDRDSWASEPGFTCLTLESTRSLFDGFTLDYFDEIEDDRPTALDEPKHWHVFEVIATKLT